MTCCGQNRASTFCPECGRKLRKVGTLKSLLAHLRRQQHLAELRADRRPQVVGLADTLAKWKSWGDALERVMGGGVEGEDA
jgi:hypothetical protein